MGSKVRSPCTDSRVLCLVGVVCIVMLVGGQLAAFESTGVDTRNAQAQDEHSDVESLRALRRWLETTAQGGETQRRCAATKSSGRTYRFVHPLATFPVVSRRSGIGQRLEVNLAAMKLAKRYAASCGIKVTLMRMHHVDEPHELPDGFEEAPRPLLRSTNDGRPHLKGKVPNYVIVDEVIQLVGESRAGQHADFVVLTNADVMPYPDFYVKLNALLHTGPDTVQFTRMGVPFELQQSWPTSLTPTQRLLRALSTPPTLLAMHPGQDGFAFPTAHIPCIKAGDTHWGCAPFGGLTWHELASHSVSCAVKIRSFVDDAFGNGTDLRFTAHLDHVLTGSKKVASGSEANHPGVCNNKREAMRRERAAKRGEAWLLDRRCEPPPRSDARELAALCDEVWMANRPKQLEQDASKWWGGDIVTSKTGKRFKRANEVLHPPDGLNRFGGTDWHVGAEFARLRSGEAGSSS